MKERNRWRELGMGREIIKWDSDIVLYIKREEERKWETERLIGWDSIEDLREWERKKEVDEES